MHYVKPMGAIEKTNRSVQQQLLLQQLQQYLGYGSGSGFHSWAL